MDDLEQKQEENFEIEVSESPQSNIMRKQLKKISLTAVFIALTFILSLLTKFIPILKMPQGGSVSFEGISMILGGLYLGPIYGSIIGLGYGFLNFLFDGYNLHWGSLFFDYLFAFGFIGLSSGIFSRAYNKEKYWVFFLATFIGFLLRWISTSLSGVIFFAEYAGDKNVWLYSFILYNLPYCAGSMAAVMSIGGICYVPFKTLLRQVKMILK